MTDHTQRPTFTVTDEDRARHAARPRARFAEKASTLADAQTHAAGNDPEAYAIVDSVTLSPEDWSRFHTHLDDDQPWLEGKGGTTFDVTTTPTDVELTAENMHLLSEEQWEELRDVAVREVIAVGTHGRTGILLVDPSGHSYPRHIAHVVPGQPDPTTAAPAASSRPPAPADGLFPTEEQA